MPYNNSHNVYYVKLDAIEIKADVPNHQTTRQSTFLTTGLYAKIYYMSVCEMHYVTIWCKVDDYFQHYFA